MREKNLSLLAGALLVAFCGLANAAPIVYNSPGNVSLSTDERVELLPVVVPNGACVVSATKNVGISSDYKGIYTCVGSLWTRLEGAGWRPSVATYASLTGADPAGTVRTVRSLGRSFYWNGSSWLPLAADQNGNLVVSNQLSAGATTATTSVTAGSVTTPGGAIGGAVSTGAISTKGAVTAASISWGMVLQNAAGGNNAAATNAIGSVYANDVYIRSIGKWASEIGVTPVASGTVTFTDGVTVYLGSYKFCTNVGSTGGNYSDTSYWFGAYIHGSGSDWYVTGNPGDDDSSAWINLDWVCYN